ncbi:MAG: hypothetical protein WAM14_14365 [Candidatus Nitrosopolaris sp.]
MVDLLEDLSEVISICQPSTGENRGVTINYWGPQVRETCIRWISGEYGGSI